MIRKPCPGDRVTTTAHPRAAGVVVEVRPASRRDPIRVVVTLDGAPVPRIFSTIDLDPEAVPARNRRASNRKAQQ